MKPSAARIWHHTSSHCYTVRYCSSNKAKTAEKFYSMNVELKQLFGKVIERGEKAIEIYGTDENQLARVAKESKSERATEIYWMAGRRVNQKHVKVFKSTSTPSSPPSSSSPQSPSSRNSIEKAPHKVEETKSLVTSTKDLLRRFISSDSNRISTIPFDDADLKSISNYPLVCEKASTAQIDEALSNKLPSISKILTATMPEASRYILKKWKLAKIAELGEEGFRAYEQMTLRTGQEFHSSIENYFDNQQVPEESSPVYKLWQSVGGVLVELDPKPVLIEKSLVHPDLKYKGIIDSVAVIKGTMCALEWKTSEKAKKRLSTTFDAPIQLCAYLGALNIDPRYEISARNGYVVVAYKDGTKANAFYLSEKDVKKYWSEWLQRVQEFWIRTRDGTLPDPI